MNGLNSAAMQVACFTSSPTSRPRCCTKSKYPLALQRADNFAFRTE